MLAHDWMKLNIDICSLISRDCRHFVVLHCTDVTTGGGSIPTPGIRIVLAIWDPEGWIRIFLSMIRIPKKIQIRFPYSREYKNWTIYPGFKIFKIRIPFLGIWIMIRKKSRNFWILIFGSRPSSSSQHADFTVDETWNVIANTITDVARSAIPATRGSSPRTGGPFKRSPPSSGKSTAPPTRRRARTSSSEIPTGWWSTTFLKNTLYRVNRSRFFLMRRSK